MDASLLTDTLLDGLLTREEAKQMLGMPGRPMTDRTFGRMIADGLPYIPIRGRNYYRLESIRAWILSRETSRGSAPPRRRGRPRRSQSLL